MPSFTKDAIKASYLKLLEQKPVNQISVKDIVEDCGVSRHTFYYYFTDIPAMTIEIITEQADKIIAQYSTASSLEDCLKSVNQFLSENRKIILHLYRSVSRDLLEDDLMNICRHTVETHVQTAIGDVPISADDLEILIRFFQCECFGQAIAWLNSGMSTDINSQTARLCELTEGMIEEVITRCAKSK